MDYIRIHASDEEILKLVDTISVACLPKVTVEGYKFDEIIILEATGVGTGRIFKLIGETKLLLLNEPAYAYPIIEDLIMNQREVIV